VSRRGELRCRRGRGLGCVDNSLANAHCGFPLQPSITKGSQQRGRQRKIRRMNTITPV
jgi:hypothetical protein